MSARCESCARPLPAATYELCARCHRKKRARTARARRRAITSRRARAQRIGGT